MFNARFTALVLCAFAFSDVALGRYQWLERDGRHVALYPRRFGQEHPAVIDKLAQACGNGICATLAGAAITPLLAAQPECSQQDMADQIIDTAQQFDATTKANMIALAKEYRQAEKNTPPDFSTQPPRNRNSVFCQKAPKNAELNGLVQAQDPANDPDLFFDPAKQATVTKGSQANTAPFGGAVASQNNASNNNSSNNSNAASSSAVSSSSAAVATLAASGTQCAAQVTVTVTAGAATATAATNGTSGAISTAAAGDIGNFGSCSVPQIEFGTGFDGRRETAFQPVDKQSFNHGSAQNIDIITQSICDTLTNSCKADQTAKDTCQKARAAASAVTAKTGGQADAFNAVFGITTKFADVASVDDQGRTIAGTGNANANANASANSGNNAATGGAATSTSTTSGAIGDFGSCTTPQIEFGAGFEGRKETSFQPVDKNSFNHGSAQNIDIITQFICDTLTNSCKADQTAKDTCQKARAAADTVTAKTGGQADAFNAVFGINTKFADVAVIDNQGKVVSAGTVAVANNNAASNSTTSSANNSTSSATSSSSTNSTSTTTSSSAASSSTSSNNNNGKMNNNGSKSTNNGTKSTNNGMNNKNNGTKSSTNHNGNQSNNGTTTHNNGTQTNNGMNHNSNGTKSSNTNNGTKSTNNGSKMNHKNNNGTNTNNNGTSTNTGNNGNKTSNHRMGNGNNKTNNGGNTNNNGKMNHGNANSKNNNNSTSSASSSTAASSSSAASSAAVSSSVAASSTSAPAAAATTSSASDSASSSAAAQSTSSASASETASSTSSSAAAATTA